MKPPPILDQSRFFKGRSIFLRRSLLMPRGDTADLLPDMLAKVSADAVPCVYQTHIGRQLIEASKSKIIATLENSGRNRKVFLFQH